MSKKKYYAVKAGRKPGIYETWNETEEQTKGYSNPIFKSFPSRVEAENFIEAKDEKAEITKDVAEIVDYDLEIKKDLENDRVVVFTDGSFSGGDKPVSGFGCVIITPDGEEYEISSKVHTKKYIETNNIGPEVFAILESLKWALSNEYTKVTIYHDLNLIGKWADGSYQAKSEIAQLLIRELDEKYKIVLDIDFKWVPGHSGIPQNERADRLAKNSILKQTPVSKYGKNSFMGRGVDKKIIYEIIEEFIEYPGVRSSLREDNEDKKRYSFRFGKEKLSVSYFKNKGTTLLQGKVQFLFLEFLSRYTLHIEDFDMIKAYSDSFKQTIENKEITNKISDYSFPIDYPRDIITLIKQSHVFLAIKREEYDYSHYPMPGFRALEGHFKYLSYKNGVVIPLGTSLGSYFDHPTAGYSTLKKDNINSQKLAKSVYPDKFEEIYNFLKINRNPLSHFHSISEEGSDNTKLIKDIEEAKTIIKETIDIIVN